MNWISLGGRGRPPLTRQFMRGLRPSNSPWIGFLPTTESVVVRSSQGRFFLFFVGLGSTNVRFCHFWTSIFEKCWYLVRVCHISYIFINFHNSQILTYFQRASTSQMQVEWQMCKPRQNIQIATYFFRILLLTGTYFIRVVCTSRVALRILKMY